MVFDLKNYALETDNVFSHFPNPHFDGEEYHIYYGIIGANKFQYFKAGEFSDVGILCHRFNKEYETNYEKREQYHIDGLNLLKACKVDRLFTKQGLDAYLEYWNFFLSTEDKLRENIYSIQHFEAFKDWFNLQLKRLIQQNESKYLSEEIKKADIDQYKDFINNNVKISLEKGVKTNGKRFERITSLQASQMIQFYDWLVKPKDQEINNKNNSTGRNYKDLYIKNNFDNVSIDEVYNHFKEGLVDKKHINEDELLKFITLAFDKMEIPAQLFKLKHIQVKQKITSIFYDYYKNVATKPHGKQKLYAALLCNYFEGFKIKNVSTNFNR